MLLAVPSRPRGAVETVSEDGISGFCHERRVAERPARIDVVIGQDVIATVFALRFHAEAAKAGHDAECGFRIRWSDVDAARVSAHAALDPTLPIRVMSAGEVLEAGATLPTAGEIERFIAAEAAKGLVPEDDLASAYGLVRLSGLFDDAYYLDRYPDIAAVGMNPLLHYLVAGDAEGRQASFYFDPEAYSASTLVRPECNRLVHYIRVGSAARASTSLHFDGAWYAETYSLDREVDGLRDYLSNRRIRSPNRFFDVVRYLDLNADLRSLADPYKHYAEWGVREGRRASRAFNAKFYYQTYLNGDTAQSALLHYLSAGRFQGFLPAPPADEPSIAGEVRTFSQPGPFFESEPVAVEPGRSPVKTFAFYLPQMHPIPENDAFWGTGFTEWRNLSRGQPRFAGHYQPRTPRDLGYYDLLDPRTIRKQVHAAQNSGIFGFCYYFYWFNGRRVLEKPLDLFVQDESLTMPFCLMWANENWTRRWDGQEQDILLRQDYDPGHDEALFDCLAGYFASPRYYRIGGRPLLTIYRPGIIPNAVDFFRRLRAGIKARLGVEPILFMSQAFGDEDPRPFGLDGAMEFPPHKVTARANDTAQSQHVLDWNFSGQVFDYDEVATIALADEPDAFPLIKTVLPMWDNDARKQGSGLCIHGSTPAKFSAWFEATCAIACRSPIEGEPLVFVNAWNEWCEGAYLEPDLHHGWAYLNAVARVLSQEPPVKEDGRRRILLVGHDAFPAGAQYLLLNIGRQLRDFGFDIAFYLLTGGDLVEDYKAVGPVLLGAEEPTGDVLRRLRRAGYAHALTNTSASGSLVPWLKGHDFRVISLVHELPSLIRSYGLEGSCQALAEKADHVIFASSYVADRFYALTGTGSERALLREQGLYNDVTAAGDLPGLREELGLPPEARIVLGVGYGDLRKGVDVFANFSRQMQSVDPALHFVWVGALDPAVATWITADRARAASSTLHFAGHRSDVARFYGLADFVFLPSREDPYPTVVLEALAAGLGVVGFTDCGGFSELLADPKLGRLLPFGDFEAFTAAARALVAQNGDEGLKAERAEFVRKHFDWGDYCFDLAKVLFPDLKSVSVVVPNYNYARFLDERLTSIFEQTYPVREIIVLDDASTDDSVASVAAASEKAQRTVDLVMRRTNSGNVFRQWKKGLDCVHGDHVWIAEADDAADPAFLERLVPALASLPKPGFAFCDSQAIDSEGRTVYENYKGYYAADGDRGLDTDAAFAPLDFLRRFLVVRNLVLNVSAVLWDGEQLRDVFRRLGDEAFRFHCAGDWRVYLESCLAGGDVAYVADPLNHHRRHALSVTHALAKPQHFGEIARVQDLALASVPDDPELRARVSKVQAELRASWDLGALESAA
ncbi:D-inositol-3-phosphate glycosyltransferase [Methylobacterium aerolatum]|nr:D-inositol-3-phosphate glycosyltransferase [Methylobacterium aerolatum]